MTTGDKKRAHTLTPSRTVRCLDRDTAGDCIGRAGLSGLWLRYPKHLGVHPGAEMRWREKGGESHPPFLLPARTKKHSRFGTEASQHVRRRRALPGALVSRLESQLVVGVMPCAFI